MKSNRRILATSIAALLSVSSALAVDYSFGATQNFTISATDQARSIGNGATFNNNTGDMGVYWRGSSSDVTYLHFNLGSLDGGTINGTVNLNFTVNAQYGDNITNGQVSTANVAWTYPGSAPGFTAIGDSALLNGNFGTGSVATWTLSNATFQGLVNTPASFYGLAVSGGNPSTAHFTGTPTLTGNATATKITVTGATDWNAAVYNAGSSTLSISGGDNVTGGNVLVRVGATLSAVGAATLDSGSFGGSIINSGTLAFGSSANQTLGGVISGNGALAKSGTGTLTLSGANTHTGGTTVAAGGTLNLANSLALQNSTLADPVAVVFDASVGSNSFTLGGLSGAGALALQNNAGSPAAINLNVGNNNANTTFSGTTSGAGSLTKVGTGVLTLTSALGYTGATNVTGGTLRVAGVATSAVGGAARRFDASNLGLADGAGVATWNDVSGNGQNATVPGGNGTPTYIANAGTGTGLGAINFTAGTGANDSQALTFTRDTNVRTVFSIFKGSSFLMTDSDNYGFHRPGDGDPADALLINYGGDTPALVAGTTFVNGVQVNPESFAMPTSLNNGYNLVAMTTNGTAVAVNGFNKDRIYHSGNQSQAEVLIYDTVLSAVQRLHNESYLSNKWFGTGSAASLPFSPVTISNGGALELAGNHTIPSISATDASSTKLVIVGGLTVGDATSTTFDGVISSAGTLTKVGSGKLTLTGASTFTGATIVNGGTLEVDGNIAGSTIAVNSGGTLGGDGTVGNVNVNTGGTLAPGSSPGILTSTGNLSLSIGATFGLELAGTTAGTGYDQMIIGGDLSLGGSTLFVSLSFSPTDGDLFTVLLNNGGNPVTGTFSGLANGDIFTVGPQSFQISYFDDASTGAFETSGGNDVSFKAVPEPGAAVSLLSGLGILLGLRRRRA